MEWINWEKGRQRAQQNKNSLRALLQQSDAVFLVYEINLMAAVSGPARQSRVSMSVSMSIVQGGAAAQQGAILAAAAPYYQPAVSQDVVPDRPIGYGAFGVVWWVKIWFKLLLLLLLFVTSNWNHSQTNEKMIQCVSTRLKHVNIDLRMNKLILTQTKN